MEEPTREMEKETGAETDLPETEPAAEQEEAKKAAEAKEAEAAEETAEDGKERKFFKKKKDKKYIRALTKYNLEYVTKTYSKIIERLVMNVLSNLHIFNKHITLNN